MEDNNFNSSSYNFIVNVSDFSGPFDLLLSLIKEKKMDIMNIDLIVVANQYIEFVNKHLSSLKIDDMVEYLAMATYLLELKSKKALPVIDTYEKLTTDMERDAFIQRLLVYKQYKAIVPQLIDKFNTRMKMHSKETDNFSDYFNMEENEVFLPTNLDIKKIISAMQKVYVKFQDKKFSPVKLIDVKELSIEEVEQDIINYLEKVDFNNKITLTSFLVDIPKEKFTKQYFVVAFVALLVLVRNSVIKLEQKDLDEIYIIKIKAGE